MKRCVFLKEKEANALQKFVEFKKKFNEINTSLKENLTELNKVNEKVEEFKQESKAERKRKEKRRLKSKEDEVQEKIKRGEKLTTEDLLVFQQTKD